MDAAIEAEGLVKRYGEVVALGGLDLSVPEGIVLGLLGPNGAGKTTAVSILATLTVPDEGRASVAGIDVLAHPERVRRSIGLSGQYAAVDEVLTGFENLVMIGRLYRLGRSASRRRAQELLERFELADAGDRQVKGYSGGMRRRLDLAGALVAEPPVLFLDEPTTGLDPRSRLDLWAVIDELVSRGTTLLLTTQYLEEADHLANEIMVIDHGLAIAQGTADELKSRVGGDRLEVTVAESGEIAAARGVIAAVTGGEVELDETTLMLLAPATRGTNMLPEVIRGLDSARVSVQDIAMRRPTLDDVFLSLTGRHVESDPATTGREAELEVSP